MTFNEIRQTIDFIMNRFIMKLFKTTDMNTVKDYFSVFLPISFIANRTEKLFAKLN